ncbi:MAG: ATP-grasp domain-containing protein [Coriobacteriia bacterium]|nr:ATP-grasp domain-containing protein [Coriobacteriia bacterium]
MVILTAPFAAPNLVMWLSQSGHAVLDNDYARIQNEGLADMGYATLNLVDEAEAVERLNAGERLYTSAENALEWVEQHVDNPQLTAGIRACKDKEVFRRALESVGSPLFYKTFDVAELGDVDPTALPLPVVLKPVVGFCSVGVYVIKDAADWADAVAQIQQTTEQWTSLYPASVVGTGRFIVEQMIGGQEFALDMYYDGQGRARILNLFQHDFSSPEDTKDRLYWTSCDLLRTHGNEFARWLDQANQALGLRDFCVHVELRRDDDGQIVPIEFNPLRFAGMGGTDLAWYGYGFITVEEYLTGDQGITADSDVDDFLQTMGIPLDSPYTYSMSVIELPAGRGLDVGFDWDGFYGNITDVLATYQFEPKVHGALGFVFKRSTADTLQELDWLRDADLTPYVVDL